MAEIINLRQVRKAREMAEKEARASENRIRFGRSKSSKSEAERKKSAEERRLDGFRLDTPDRE